MGKRKNKADLDLEVTKAYMKAIHDEEMMKLKNAQEKSLKELDMTEAGQKANAISKIKEITVADFINMFSKNNANTQNPQPIPLQQQNIPFQ